MLCEVDKVPTACIATHIYHVLPSRRASNLNHVCGEPEQMSCSKIRSTGADAPGSLMLAWLYVHHGQSEDVAINHCHVSRHRQ